MNKRTVRAFGKDVYLLGVNSDGEYLWLEAPSWDCGWYWGLGYVESYTNNRNPNLSRDITHHTHFDLLFEKHIDWMDLKSPFTKDEKYLIYELMQELYVLRKMADMMHQNSTNFSSGNKALKAYAESNKAECDRINKKLIPAVWEELVKILYS